MIRPPFLRNGSTIALLSTARFISPEELERPMELLRSWGLNVICAPGIFQRENQFAGTDTSRLNDLQWALDSRDIDAVLCVRGGYGTVRIVDDVDYTAFMKKPKWIAGYSDVTVLHNKLNQELGMCSLHTTMPISFATNTSQSLETLKKALFGELNGYDLPPLEGDEFDRIDGELVGGNLSILYSMLGSKSQLNTNNKILFIEDLDEMLYHLDRMLQALKRAGMLDGLKALLVGGISDMRDNTKVHGFDKDNPYGQTAKEIIAAACSEFDFPVLFDFPAGHTKDNRALVLGGRISLRNKERFTLKFTDSFE